MELVVLPNELLNMLIDSIDNSLTFFNILQTNSIFMLILSHKNVENIKKSFCTITCTISNIVLTMNSYVKIYNNILPNGYKHGNEYKIYNNKTVIRKGVYHNNKKHGPITKYYYSIYHSNRIIKEVGQYYNNQKEGRWIGYHKTGKISSIEDYKNGEITNCIYYNLLGRPIF